MLSSLEFPNAPGGAQYNPYSLSISIDITSIELQEIRKSEGNLDSLIPLLAHEYQHFVDHTGTRFGRKWLNRIFSALSALDEKFRGVEGNFHQLLLLKIFNSIAFRKRYYTMTIPEYQDIGSDRNEWRMEPTVGHAFDRNGAPNPDAPILFIRFHAIKDDLFFARQPISAASLFEIKAVSSQLRHEAAFAAAHGSGAALRRFHHDTLDAIYDPQLTLYSVAAHFLAQQCGERDILRVYDLGARLANIALNMSSEDFAALAFPDAMERAAPEEFPAFRRNEDVGAAFAALACGCASAADHVQPQDSVDAWVEAALRAAGLRAEDAILAEAAADVSMLSLDLIGPRQSPYIDVLRNARQNRDLIGVATPTIDLFSLLSAGRAAEVFLPRVYFKDRFAGQIFGREPEFLAHGYDAMRDDEILVDQVDQFADACF